MRVGPSITGTKVAKMIKKKEKKKFCVGGWALGMDEIREVSQGFGCCYCLLIHFCAIAWTLGAVPLEKQAGAVVSLFKKWGLEGVFQL